MKTTRLIMGMPVTVEIVDDHATAWSFQQAFEYFEYVDAKFSTYKETSEISRINRGEMILQDASEDMKLILALAEQTRQETDGFFDIRHNGTIDPSGIVKGWAIQQVAEQLAQAGFENYFVDAGGDIQMAGKNADGNDWRVGIRNPFQPQQIVKSLTITNCGVATSGVYLRGNHIYDPIHANKSLDEILSLTVIGSNIYEADRFATAAFAMGRDGILFIEALDGFEGYMIDKNGQATLTSGFHYWITGKRR